MPATSHDPHLTRASNEAGDAAALSSSHPALSGQDASIRSVEQVGVYKILGILGSGGMGIVYKAFDQKLGRIVALKMLHIGVDPNPDLLIRFRGEAETLGSLQHPHIVQVFDFGMHKEDSPYLVLEYVEGGTLEKKLAGKPQYPRKAAEMIELLARAMHAAHQKGIVHRDLKPANILVTSDGLPKITDFGLAKRLKISAGLTPTHAIMGTPSYMAPEQAAGKADVGATADVYALGAILYEMMTGRPPFLGATLPETLEQVRMADPPPPNQLVPNLPVDLQTVCLKCLQKSPGRRYLSAHELADDLKNFMDGMPVKARREHSFQRVIRVVARNKHRVALAGATLLVFLLLGFMGVGAHLRAQKEEADRLEQTYKDQLAQKAADAEKAQLKENMARQNFEDLKTMLTLTTAGDLHTPAGLEKLEKTLSEVEKDAESIEKSKMFAGAYYRLATNWKQQGEVDRALDALRKAAKRADQAAKLAVVSSDREKSTETAAGNSLENWLLRPRIYQLQCLLQSESGKQEAVDNGKAALRFLECMASTDTSDEFVRLHAETLHDLGVAMWFLRPEGKDAEYRSARRANMAKAEEYYVEARKLLANLVERPEPDHDDQKNLARTLGYLGSLYLEEASLSYDFDHDRFQKADAYFWKSHMIREALASKPKLRDYESKFQLARSWCNFGRSLTRQRNLRTAIHFYCKAEQLRTELIQTQADNKQYVLELASVLNRIAELELFAADKDQEPDVKKQRELAESAKQRSLRCAQILTEMIDLMKLDQEHVDRAAYTRAYSHLGECYALLARAELIRHTLTPDKKTQDDARTAARAAVDTYQLLKERREEDKSQLSVDEMYQQAAAKFLSLGIYVERSGDTKLGPGAAYYEGVKKELKQSVDRGFYWLAPQEIMRDRAFDFLRLQERQWLAEMLDAKSAPAKKDSLGNAS